MGEFYVFVNLSNQITKNNFELTKKIYSKPKVPGALSLFEISRDYLENRLMERDAEEYRKKINPLLPSRTNIFAFGDFNTCKVVSQKYGWNLSEVKTFTLDLGNNFLKVNMEIISFARDLYKKIKLDENQKEKLWAAYWGSHEPLPDEILSFLGIDKLECHWEYIIEGCLTLKDSKIY